MARLGARAADRPDLANHGSAGDDPGCIRIVVSELHTVESSDSRRAQLRVHPCSFSGAELHDVGAVARFDGKGCPNDHKSGARAAHGIGQVCIAVQHPARCRTMPPHVKHAASMPVLHLCTQLHRLCGLSWLCSSLHLGSRHLRPLHSPAGRGFRSRARPVASGLPVCPSSDFRVSSSQAQRSMVTLCPLRRRRCWRAAAIATAKRRRRQATRAAAAPVPAAFRPWLWRR
jgi:hypothetical protein